jgi:hypothetical protein
MGLDVPTYRAPTRAVPASDTAPVEEPPPAAPEPAPEPLTKQRIAQIKKEMIQASIDAYAGSCPCPYNTARNGSRCGRRSAYD